MSDELVKRITHLVPPYRVVRDLGGSVRRERRDDGVLFYTPHPHNQDAKLYLTTFEFVEPSKATGFFGGTVLDYMALTCGSYRAGVDRFFELYRDRIQGISNYEIDYIKEFIETSAKRDRAVFDFLNSLTRNYFNLEKFEFVTGYLRGLAAGPAHQSVDSIHHWGYLATPGEVAQFVQDFCVTPPFDPTDTDKPYWVVPYYNTWSNISHIRFEQPSIESGELLTINPAKTAFAGLHASSQFHTKNNVLVFDSQQNALTVNSWLRYSLDSTLCLLSDSQSEFVQTEQLRFNSITALLGDRPSLAALSRLSKWTNEFKIHNFANYQTYGKARKWEQYLADTALEIIKEDGSITTPRLAALLSSAEPDSDLKEKLFEVLKAQCADENELHELQSLFRTTRVYTFRGCSIEETPYGYVSEHGKTNQRKLITNFTIDIESSVILQDQENRPIILVGTVHLGERTFPIQIPKTETVTFKLIEDAVLAAFNKWQKRGEVDQQDGPKVPVICAPEEAKCLPGIISQKIAAAPYKTGFSHYGWVNKDHFIAPYWERKDINITEGPTSVLAVTGPASTCFTSAPFPGMTSTADLDVRYLFRGQLFNALNWLISFLVRGSFEYPLQPLAIPDTANNRNMLKAITVVFGQVYTPTLNLSARRKTMEKLLPHFKGLPMVVQSDSPELVKKFNGALYVLTPTDEPQTEAWSREELYRITQATWSLTRTILNWLVTTDTAPAVSFSQNVTVQEEVGGLLATLQQQYKDDPVVNALAAQSINFDWQTYLSGKHDETVLQNLFFAIELDAYVLLRRNRGKRYTMSPTQLAESAGEVVKYDVEGFPPGFVIPKDFVEYHTQIARVSTTPIRLRQLQPEMAEIDKITVVESPGRANEG